MHNKTPATHGSEGFEKLAGRLEAQFTTPQFGRQVTCTLCAFFDPQAPGYGYCRRNAPGENGFPGTGAQGWCGEFLARAHGSGK